MKKNSGKILLKVILALILIISFLRLISFTIEFSEESLQMDFTAYYFAGKSLNNGLSPYENHVLSRWDLWDGVNMFKHSRFLYPPLIANLFQPLASLPYIKAKYIWNFFNLFCYLLCFVLLIKIFLFSKDFIKILIAGILTFNFFPFITLLERGQIDCITFLLLLTGLMLLVKSKKYHFTSGFLMGITSLFKLYSLLLLPFFLIRKKFIVVYGYISGMLLIIILTLLICGLDTSYNYLTKEAVRISEYGSSGSNEMAVPVKIIQKFHLISPYSMAIIDGRIYLTESISFNSKASFIKTLEVLQSKASFNLSNTTYSVMVFAFFFILMIVYSKKYKIKDNDFVYWQVILIIILLSSPYTWVMNLVWLTPVAFIMINSFSDLMARKKSLILVTLIVGYLFLSLPDNLLLTEHVPLIKEFFSARYVMSQLLILFSLVIYLKDTETKNDTAIS
ncbi:MAG: DUF2029 domain-containing protein [Ignavibacteria bacterium]|nr:DUF2029 domain-containing protein [Ignavibacteria bacterium]